MNKRLKDVISYSVFGIALVVLPMLVLNYFGERRREMFHRHAREDHQACRESALQASRDGVWCDEIRDGAKLAYSAAEGSNQLSQLLIMIQPLLFVLFISIYNLRKQVEEIKEKN